MAAKKRRDPHRTSTRPRGRIESIRPTGSLDDLTEHHLLEGVDQALRDPHPLALLTLVSGLVAAVEPTQQGMPSEPVPGLPTLTELVDSFIDVGYRQTDAVLLVIAQLAGDDLMRERIRRSVAERHHPMPGWLLRLDHVEPYRAVKVTHILGDGDDIIIGVRLPGRRECSIVVYIDHNMGTVVKDAFILDRSLEDVREVWVEHDPERESEIADLALADARTQVVDAIEKGAITFPPFESTKSWLSSTDLPMRSSTPSSAPRPGACSPASPVGTRRSSGVGEKRKPPRVRCAGSWRRPIARWTFTRAPGCRRSSSWLTSD
jgi:hypothetical protein